jgi:hypothetical protein
MRGTIGSWEVRCAAVGSPAAFTGEYQRIRKVFFTFFVKL